jgi:hypothetical protein
LVWLKAFGLLYLKVVMNFVAGQELDWVAEATGAIV